MADFEDRLRKINAAQGEAYAARQNDPGLIAERRKALKARRYRVANVVSAIIGVPILIFVMVFWKDAIELWAYQVGLLPDWGIVQLLNYDGPIDWDSVALSGVIGAVTFGLIWILVYPFVCIAVR